jgi:hypothetical protein
MCSYVQGQRTFLDMAVLVVETVSDGPKYVRTPKKIIDTKHGWTGLLLPYIKGMS